MSWGHDREVHVTSRAELDAALRSANRIVVEGDANLADYASRIAVVGRPHAAPPAPAAQLRPLAAQERDAHVASAARPPRLWPWVAGAVGLAISACAALLLEHFARTTAFLPHAVTSSGPGQPLLGAGSAPRSLDTLAWPGVAVALIVALYLIARQAISSGRDVQIAWQVTEKVGGRVVITKVRTRAA